MTWSKMTTLGWACLRGWCAAALLSSAGLAEEADLISSTNCACFGQVNLTYNKSEQEFVLRAQFMPIADPTTPYSVWVQEAVDNETFFYVGDMMLVNAGTGGAGWRLELLTIGHAPPALGVSELSELSGRLVQVREFGTTNAVLWGAMPLAVPPTKPTGEVWAGRLDLQRPEGMERATGFVELSKTGTHQTFVLRAWKLDWGPKWENRERIFAVFIETGITTGDFKPVGNLKCELKVSGNYDFKLQWELKLWSSTGGPPVLGVADLSELASRRVRVRDDLERIWLETALPPLALKGTLRSVNWRVALVPVTALPLSGQVTIKFDPKRGRSRCDWKTRGLTAGNTYGVYVEDGVGAGTFTEFTSLNSKGQFKSDTQNGDRLPFGVPRIIDLTGRIVEIRNQDGTTLLRGLLP